jgi:hypothetical protein
VTNACGVNRSRGRRSRLGVVYRIVDADRCALDACEGFNPQRDPARNAYEPIKTWSSFKEIRLNGSRCSHIRLDQAQLHAAPFLSISTERSCMTPNF